MSANEIDLDTDPRMERTRTLGRMLVAVGMMVFAPDADERLAEQDVDALLLRLEFTPAEVEAFLPHVMVILKEIYREGCGIFEREDGDDDDPETVEPAAPDTGGTPAAELVEAG